MLRLTSSGSVHTDTPVWLLYQYGIPPSVLYSVLGLARAPHPVSRRSDAGEPPVATAKLDEHPPARPRAPRSNGDVLGSRSRAKPFRLVVRADLGDRVVVVRHALFSLVLRPSAEAHRLPSACRAPRQRSATPPRAEPYTPRRGMADIRASGTRGLGRWSGLLLLLPATATDARQVRPPHAGQRGPRTSPSDQARAPAAFQSSRPSTTLRAPCRRPPFCTLPNHGFSPPPPLPS